MCWLLFNNGPSSGKTNQLTKTGGSSINQANPEPVINLVLALNVNAATIIKIIHVASVIAILDKMLLTARNMFIILK